MTSFTARLIVAAICMCAGFAMATEPVGVVVKLSGPLSVKKTDGTVKALAANSSIDEGDTLITAKDAYAMIRFSNKSEITLRPGTTFKVAARAAEVLPDFMEIGVRAESLLMREKFDELDKLAEEHLHSKAHLQGGNSPVYHFYGALGSSEERPVYNYWSGIPFTAKKAQLERWRKARPNSPHARIALAELWIAQAWKIRGGERANETPPENLKKMHEFMQNAKSLVDAVDSRGNPHVVYLRIESAWGLNGPRSEIDRLYSEGIRDFPEYLHFYSQRAIILTPVWMGQRGELQDYLRSIQSGLPGSARSVAYAYVAHTLIGRYPRPTLLQETGLDWKFIKTSYSERERLYGLRNRDWNALCFLALAASDRALARIALDHIGTNWDGTIFHEQKYFDADVAWIRK